MSRINSNLTDEHHKILRVFAAERGISVSKLLRKIISEWIQQRRFEDSEAIDTSHKKIYR